jgi:opacity protein-like surface antigen
LSGEVTQTTRLPPNFVHILSGEAWTRLTAFTANARFRIPLGAMRASAYGLGGLGAARVTDAFTVVYIQPGPNPITTTYARAAFTVGGGLSIPMTDRLAVDAEARVLRVAGDRSRSIGRVGGGVSLRF